MKKLLYKLLPSKKLQIIYRHVGVNASQVISKDRPKWFTHEICFANLVKTIKDSRNSGMEVNLHVLFDGNEETYAKDFIKQYYEAAQSSSTPDLLKFKLKIFEGGSQYLAMQNAINYIEGSNFSEQDYIYLLENDYLHDSRWITSLDELLKSHIPFDYISLYDHPDKYPFNKCSHEMHQELVSKLFFTKTMHWRTTPSSCASFITSMKVFKEDNSILRMGLMDHLMFDELNKIGRVMVSPIPSLSTHCMARFLAPCIKWESYLEK